MYARQTETVVRIPNQRWKTARYVVRVQTVQRHRSLAIPAARSQKRTRGSFTETDARAP